jgi:hypothetical protein
MNSEKFAKPWQAMPARIISLALEHAQQNTDFNHQLAFLLLDVGVESALKTYLVNKKQDVEKIVFPDLLKRVGEELHKENLQIPLDEIDYFHKIRNKLYHQGDGVKPTDENLAKYAELAKTLVKALLNVKLDEPNEQDSHCEVLSRIRKNIASLEANSALIAEHLYPQIATRKIEAQLRHIRTTTGPDDESDPPFTRADFAQQRIDAFNKITGWEFTEYELEFIEYVIDNPERLHVQLAFEEMDRDNWHKDWWEYKSVIRFLEYRYEFSKTDEKRYEEMDKWINEKAKGLYRWVETHIDHVTPKEFISLIFPLDLDSLFDRI